jgi:hypothetical protein
VKFHANAMFRQINYYKTGDCTLHHSKCPMISSTENVLSKSLNWLRKVVILQHLLPWSYPGGEFGNI